MSTAILAGLRRLEALLDQIMRELENLEKDAELSAEDIG